MEANKAFINQIFSNRLLEVPYYQRAYVWGQEQWDKFLDDMEYVTKTRRPYFLGSLILKKGKDLGTAGDFSDHRMIIDGQQRLTTLTIYLRVLFMKTNQLQIFEKNFYSDSGTVCLLHGKYDSEAYHKIMEQTEPVTIDNPEPKSKMIEAYNYFVANLNPDKVEWNFIKQNIRFVAIDLAENEDEQQIFDTINSAGVRLTTSELLKNYFFTRDNIDEYERSWEQVFDKDDDTRSYWYQDFETGRIKRAMIDLFFDAYFQQFIQDKRYNVSAEDKITYSRVERLSKSYQDFVNKSCGGDKQVVLKELAASAKCFAQNLRPECKMQSIPSKPCIERLNVIIFGMKYTVMLPYVLYVLRNVESPETRNQIFGVLESYIMRRMVVHATIGNYNNLFTSLILNEVQDPQRLVERLGGNGNASTYIPTDENLREGFRNSKLVNQQTKGILYMLESSMRPAYSGLKLLGFDGYSLEHMMPKKWRNNWAPCATAEEARIRDNKLLTLGNLALITQPLNASISDSDWATKKKGKANKGGLDNCADGLLTMKDVLEKDAWTEADIDARAEWLYEQAKVLWHIDCVQPEEPEAEAAPAAEQQKEKTAVRKRVSKPLTQRQKLYREFWAYALPTMRAAFGGKGPFSGCLGTKSCYLNGFFGISGFSMCAEAKPGCAAITFSLGTSNRNYNKAAYDFVYARKDEVEARLGEKVEWLRFDGIASYISVSDNKYSVMRREQWDEMIANLAEQAKKMYDVIVPMLFEWKKNYKV